MGTRSQTRTAGTQSYVLGLHEIGEAQVGIVGGKAARLGELSRMQGMHVPPGFCVTTHAFRRATTAAASLGELLDRLSRLEPDDREAISALSADVRRTIEAITIPDDVARAIVGTVAGLGEDVAYAVRSSATAEDSPTASFAGQHDTYLNVLGPAAILQHVRRCWTSLFTERAVSYRLHDGLDQRQVQMAVIVQQMVAPRAAGILFTADPVTGNRTVASVEASFGLGEAVVSGRVNPDVYKVREGKVVARSVATKLLATHASPHGRTHEQAIEPERQQQPVLTDAQVIELAQLGRRIEARFESPQDIEWCLVDDGFAIVQARPITTLFPIPAAREGGNRVYVSVGHGQMMTDAIKPLGLSLWLLTTPAPMTDAGGRLFVDVTERLASPASRAAVLEVMGGGDPLIRDALETVIERGDFISLAADGPPVAMPAGGAPTPIESDPAIVAELIERRRASLARLRREIRGKRGSALVEFILEDINELKRMLFDPTSHQVVMAGMEATWWLNGQLAAWLGEQQAADTLTQSVPNNVTSEMGLALLDVADAIRPHRDVVAFLEQVEGEDFLDDLADVPGGRHARDAIRAFLDRYGMRCVGEIDITRPRWSERPAALVPAILANVRTFEPGEARRRFEHGRQQALEKEHDLLERLRAMPDGERKAEEAKRMIDRVRTFIGYREYPKYHMVSRYFAYKEALLEEAGRLVRDNVLREPQDIFYLTLQELHDVLRTHEVDDQLVAQRKDAYRSWRTLTPPRVLTSEGEAVTGAYRRDELPSGVLIGLPVSRGTVEGRARVVLDMAQADLEPGDILVTACTDPGWSPVFLVIEGLVTEVGGLMTHGAVIAREYGLPAVVGVEHATRLIRDGQRIRVHGTGGYVEILPE
jgi:phosphoenolpyruvate synthase/pyruvate phosphate dikinase